MTVAFVREEAVKLWAEHGSCRGMNPDLFDDAVSLESWTGEPVTVNIAKRTCSLCPYREDCLEDNLTEAWGVWGGLNTVERQAYADGAIIRFCDGCGQRFARKVAALCVACQKTPQTSTLLREWEDEIGDLAAQGNTDVRIAAILVERTGDDTIRETHVRTVRRKLGITAGFKQGLGKDAVRHIAGYTAASVFVAQERGGAASFNEMSDRERHELMRRWLRDGGTSRSFETRYHCSYRIATELRDEVLREGT